MLPTSRSKVILGVLLALVLVLGGALLFKDLLTSTSDSGQTPTIYTGQTTTRDLQPTGSWHLVGAPNETPFGTSSIQPRCMWQNGFHGKRNATAFYRDSRGIVHLRGQVETNGTCDPDKPLPSIFSLPPGYRPDIRHVEPSSLEGGAGFSVTITPAGVVGPRPYYPGARRTKGELDGITFRWGPRVGTDARKATIPIGLVDPSCEYEARRRELRSDRPRLHHRSRVGHERWHGDLARATFPVPASDVPKLKNPVSCGIDPSDGQLTSPRKRVFCAAQSKSEPSGRSKKPA